MGRPVGRRDVLRAGAVGAATWLGGIPVVQLLRDVTPASAGRWRPSARDATTDAAFLTAAEASALIRARKITPSDLVEACLARVKRFDPSIQAYVTVLQDGARDAAATATKRINRQGQRSVLDGVPIAHKDIIDVKGVRTTCGSRVRSDAPPASSDAPIVARLRRAGAITLGKVNPHEFAFGVWSPPTSNPWDTTRVPGGSSGGSAAALAAGMTIVATGTDTGGSIRIPSSLCNTVGLKPTFGRCSRAGVFPLSWTMDHTGPITRSVEDAALLLNVMAGRDAADPTTARAPVPDFTSGLGRSIRGTTIGVPTDVFFDGADPETEARVHAAAAVFKKLGARVIDIDVPATQNEASTAWTVIQLVEPLSIHETYLRGPHAADYMPQTLVLLGLGGSWHAQEYLRAQRIRTINIREWLKIFEKVDIVLTPATPRPAPTKEEAEATGVFDLVNDTAPFDFNGFPSISVPGGFTTSGLPVGVMLGARPFAETDLLRVAYAYQQETQFHRARPHLA